ncbi:TPA: hypothetical protein ACGJWA_002456 [Pseudomonas aeruginosa]|uniref:hypothetical protein n=1 Tax=Pseudomonas aeruginosa TaxID=287 RepID=UPI00053D3857|nr:hypothetical protein [Pseudomonas aeruginosa]RRD26857.1 hypothetical protein ECB98_04640 [Brucellaceae bacterium VT-16-1752]HBO1237266.1 hypothetical protein [Pseudomonas aeruginosa]HBO1875739.1 hypothetical protein [Pseudomonas aeruginosa]HBO2079875.1 hypothetical protein [Pseudomonas aeruginosa]HCH7472699.1 hypothetical protein [Pseudomonas aeruginosa]
MPKFSFRVERCPPEKGIGWEIRFFEGRFEFPDTQIIAAASADEEALQFAYQIAESEAESWIVSMGGWPPRLAKRAEPGQDDRQLGFGWDVEDATP